MKTFPRRALLALVAVLCLGSSSESRADYAAFMRSMFPTQSVKPVQRVPAPVKPNFRPQKFTGTGQDKLQNFQIQQTMSDYTQSQSMATSVLKKQQEAQAKMIKKLK